MPTHFQPEALKFLRGLAKHNDREWFEPRRAIYERALKGPMLALIDEVNHAMVEFAPEHVRPPHKIMMRIYRDIRFAKDKRPYKRHVSAWWARRGMEKTSGGGFYLHIHPEEVLVSAGVYMPEREQLLAIRRHLSEHAEEYRALHTKILKAKGMSMTDIDGALLTRMPKGFAKDDPADELVRARNWGVHATLPASVAEEPGLLREIVKRFKLAAPLVEMLNAPLVREERRPNARF
ncbi:MAG TPA: DUF2461 domain-containing protein [Acidobacteriaceae bacterium]|nr:DUF2461 domain-containing protein [Acidobacteriaceae bacterium]